MSLPEPKTGDRIQSFDLTKPVDLTRGSFIGTVTGIVTDPVDGVDYVHYKAESRCRNGTVVEQLNSVEMRAPQNNTPTLLGGLTDGIIILQADEAPHGP